MKPNCRDIHLADQVQEVTHVIKLRCLFLVSFFFFPFFYRVWMKSSSNYQLSKSRKDRKTVTFITAVLAVLASDNLKDSTILMERSGFPFFPFYFYSESGLFLNLLITCQLALITRDLTTFCSSHGNFFKPFHSRVLNINSLYCSASAAWDSS